jgi:hypothetical protein
MGAEIDSRVFSTLPPSLIGNWRTNTGRTFLLGKRNLFNKFMIVTCLPCEPSWHIWVLFTQYCQLSTLLCASIAWLDAWWTCGRDIMIACCCVSRQSELTFVSVWWFERRCKKVLCAKSLPRYLTYCSLQKCSQYKNMRSTRVYHKIASTFDSSCYLSR